MVQNEITFWGQFSSLVCFNALDSTVNKTAETKKSAKQITQREKSA